MSCVSDPREKDDAFYASLAAQVTTGDGDVSDVSDADPVEMAKSLDVSYPIIL